ncbi:hypothetical protein [Liquorilactobacillus nagelii]|uniref:hypothetical protein n=1 Tax=Liquorilactobacillus nagelii TaxID=82688 RepID=UPI0007107559|nr:hypothetical protein [Liquorilactobacillus nagelii]QYH53692.1 hypothetical protein G6O73_02850 [Liquorilactobacillus nagelii DSM 13675]
MRYLDTITFVKKTASHYDPDLGQDVEGESKETSVLCHVVTPSMTKSALVIGDLKTTDVIVHLKQPFLDTFDYALINNTRYTLELSKTVNRRQILTLKGGNANGSNT